MGLFFINQHCSPLQEKVGTKVPNLAPPMDVIQSSSMLAEAICYMVTQKRATTFLAILLHNKLTKSWNQKKEHVWNNLFFKTKVLGSLFQI
jgi:hypothetical protein